MCGLFGGIGKLSGNRMIALGSMNEERGTDSVGLAYPGHDGTIMVAKVAERPCVGLNITLRKEVTEAAVSGMFIGHTRAATQGTVNSRNAHPFLTDGIAFAHNGIITNDETFGKYEVDSECLIHGIKARDFSKYEGPIALVWIEGGVLKAFHCGNPLARGRYNGGTYLASEGDYLRDIGCTHVKELAEGMIYTFTSPTELTTERVPKNQVHAASYTSKSIYTGAGWEDYLERTYKRKGWAGTPSPCARDAELVEDFRTPSDITRAVATRKAESCEVCGATAELSERGMCLDCLQFIDQEGIDRDSPPSWLKVH